MGDTATAAELMIKVEVLDITAPENKNFEISHEEFLT